jgi:hypothetical protein
MVDGCSLRVRRAVHAEKNMMLIFHTGPGQAELLDFPEHPTPEHPRERCVASGQWDAVVAAANLIAGPDGWQGASMHEVAIMDIRRIEDQRVFDLLSSV